MTTTIQKWRERDNAEAVPVMFSALNLIESTFLLDKRLVVPGPALTGRLIGVTGCLPEVAASKEVIDHRVSSMASQPFWRAWTTASVREPTPILEKMVLR